MSDERIDIQINDKIAASIPTKLEQIAASATKGQASVAKLKAELASINTTAVTKLKDATDTSVAAINRELNAQRGLTKATEAEAASDIKAATEKGKKTAAIDAEAAAQARLAAVIDRTIARQQAQAAANASTSLGKGKNPFQAEADLAAASAAVSASTRTMETAVAEAEVATVSRFARIKSAATTTYDFLRDAAYQQASNFKGFFGSGGAATIEKEAEAVGKLGGHARGSSTAVRELFTLMREGGRGDFTRMAGSATILATALGLMNSVMIPAAIILGTLAAAMKLFQVSIQSEADPQLKAYANTLGLTHKEMRKLGDETVSAKGKLEEFNSIKLTFGDVFHGLTKTINDTFNLSPTLNKLKNDVYNAMVTLAKNTAREMAEVYGVFYAVYNNVGKVWKNLPSLLGSAVVAAANEVIKALEDMVNDGIGALNKLIHGANTILDKVGMHVGDIGTVAIPRIKDAWAGATKSIRDSIASDYTEGFNKAQGAMSKFMGDWKKNSIQAAKDRLEEMADAIKNNRNPKKPDTSDPKTKSDYLNDTNKKLDDELSRMHLLKDAREEQSRLDQIEEEFAKRRQPLTEAEIAGFRAKIHAIQEFKYQQAEMDRIYEASTGPLRTYNASIAAAKDLLAQGAISQSDFTKEVTRAGRAYKEATDPLFAMKEAMAAAENALGNYGVAAQQASYYEQIRQAYLAKNIELSPQYVAGLNAEVDALMRRNGALQQGNTIQQSIGEIVNPMLQENEMLANKAQYYAELERMGKQYNLSEAQRAQARYALDLKFNQARLSAASQFFGTLAGLSSSGNKKLAMIGKAAAIAQATIDGIMAVQKALASAPPPWNVIQAGAIAVMTGVNVAKIISTPVGSYEHGGSFMIDGRAGVDNNNINFNASKGERVTIETPAQQRARDANGGQGGSPILNAKIVNQFDAREFVSAMDTDEGETLILNVIKRNPDAIAAIIPH
jgi:hypothetical protein